MFTRVIQLDFTFFSFYYCKRFFSEITLFTNNFKRFVCDDGTCLYFCLR